MADFRLYRIQVTQRQPDFFKELPSHEVLLRELIESLPKRQLKTRTYLTGDLSRIDGTAVHFRLAKSSRVVAVEIENGHFVDVEHEHYPYSDIVADLDLEICAISRNYQVCPTVDGIARQLQFLLNSATPNSVFKCDIFVDPIRDPEDFLSHLSRASQIKRFYFEVRLPNVFDAGLFTETLQKLNQEARAKKSKTMLEGPGIEQSVAQELTRASAATGDDAGATLRTIGGQKFYKRSLGKNYLDLGFSLDPLEVPKALESLIQTVREKYKAIRHGDEL